MAAQERQRRGPKRTVLIADDDRTLAKAIAATLDLDELQTVVAHDGDQALALGRELRPDLILLGVMMPGTSGIEVCATLKTDPATASIPVIFITAKMGETDRMVGIAAGADDYLTKPFSPTRLIALVRKVLTGQPVEPHLHQPAPSAVSADQLVIYARELRELFEWGNLSSRAPMRCGVGGRGWGRLGFRALRRRGARRVDARGKPGSGPGKHLFPDRARRYASAGTWCGV